MHSMYGQMDKEEVVSDRGGGRDWDEEDDEVSSQARLTSSPVGTSSPSAYTLNSACSSTCRGLKTSGFGVFMLQLLEDGG